MNDFFHTFSLGVWKQRPRCELNGNSKLLASTVVQKLHNILYVYVKPPTRRTMQYDYIFHEASVHVNRSRMLWTDEFLTTTVPCCLVLAGCILSHVHLSSKASSPPPQKAINVHFLQLQGHVLPCPTHTKGKSLITYLVSDVAFSTTSALKTTWSEHIKFLFTHSISAVIHTFSSNLWKWTYHVFMHIFCAGQFLLWTFWCSRLHDALTILHAIPNKFFRLLSLHTFAN